MDSTTPFPTRPPLPDPGLVLVRSSLFAWSVHDADTLLTWITPWRPDDGAGRVQIPHHVVTGMVFGGARANALGRKTWRATDTISSGGDSPETAYNVRIRTRLVRVETEKKNANGLRPAKYSRGRRRSHTTVGTRRKWLFGRKKKRKPKTFETRGNGAARDANARNPDDDRGIGECAGRLRARRVADELERGKDVWPLTTRARVGRHTRTHARAAEAAAAAASATAAVATRARAHTDEQTSAASTCARGPDGDTDALARRPPGYARFFTRLHPISVFDFRSSTPVECPGCVHTLSQRGDGGGGLNDRTGGTVRVALGDF